MPDSPSITLLVLKTDAVERLRDFYACLGFEFFEEQHGNGPRHWSASAGDAVLEIYPLPDDGTVDVTTRLGFGISDFEDVVESVRQLAEVMGEPKQTQWGLRAVVRDPDGRAVELYGVDCKDVPNA